MVHLVTFAILCSPLVLAAQDSAISSALEVYSDIPVSDVSAQSAWLVSFLDNYSDALDAEASTWNEAAVTAYSYDTSLDSSFMALIDSITAREGASASAVGSAMVTANASTVLPGAITANASVTSTAPLSSAKLSSARTSGASVKSSTGQDSSNTNKSSAAKSTAAKTSASSSTASSSTDSSSAASSLSVAEAATPVVLKGVLVALLSLLLL